MRFTQADGDVDFIDTSNTMDIVRLRLGVQHRPPHPPIGSGDELAAAEQEAPHSQTPFPRCRSGTIGAEGSAAVERRALIFYGLSVSGAGGARNLRRTALFSKSKCII